MRGGILLIVLWYCIDDWIARAANLPWLGDIPLPVAIVVAIILLILTP